MTNEQILEKRWRYTEIKLKKYLKDYYNFNLHTQDKIQDIYNSIDYQFLELNKPIAKSQKEKFYRKIEEWKEKKILNGYLKYKVNELLNKRQIVNEELLDVLLLGVFFEERDRLNEYEKKLFLEIGTELYNQGIDEIKPIETKGLNITWTFIYSLLCLPNSKGVKWYTYLEALALTNAEEVKRQTIINLQQGKKLAVGDNVVQNILKKQQNRYLSFKDEKISGSLDLQIREIANQSFLKAGKDTDTEECRFVSDMCEKVTMMCSNMNNYIFNITKENSFDRYMGENVKELIWTRLKVKGLQQGINLPPIIHHIHCCHSTITYQLNTQTNGLGSGKRSTQENHIVPALLKQLSNEEMKNKIAILKEYENTIKNDKIENAIVITKDGEVYQCFGNESNVWPDIDLKDKLYGASVTHNHPKAETNYSFSPADINMFEKYNLEVLRGVDNKYSYELNKNEPSTLKQPSWDEIIKDNSLYHLQAIQYAIENNISYKRWKNDK